jgi:hypothetical protein
MKKWTKIIIIIALILILIRIIFPVKILKTSSINYEVDSLFPKEKNSPMESTAIDYGETSITNIYHIFYVLLFAGVISYLIEKD